MDLDTGNSRRGEEVVKRCCLELERRVGNVILPSALSDGDGDGDGVAGGLDQGLPLCFPSQDTVTHMFSPGPVHRS